MRLSHLVCFAALLLGGLTVVQAQDISRTSLSVYNAGAALVHEQRSLSLEAGINHVVLRDIAATIDPTSVNFRSLSGPAGTVALEQSYIPDQRNPETLLARYLSEPVAITTNDGASFSGELLRIGKDRAVLRTDANELAFVRLYDIRTIQFPSPPDDHLAEAALQILVDSASAGQHEVELSYLAGGISWTADYNLRLAADETSLDLRGYVTLQNRSGRDYSDANLRLVAGEINRIEQEEEFAETRMMAMSAAADESSGIEPGDFSEYKLYQMPRPVSLRDSETKQIEFMVRSDIAAQITYIFDSSPPFRGYYSPIAYLEGYDSAGGIVLTRLSFDTGGEGLGLDLPAGRARVYQADADGLALLIGESQVEHTPRGEAVSLGIGTAFDLSGERIQTDFSFISRLVAQEKFEIRLRNHKADKSVEIVVPERLYRWRDWQIIESSHPFAKADNASIEFVITVEPGEEAVLSYTVQYSFPEED